MKRKRTSTGTCAAFKIKNTAGEAMRPAMAAIEMHSFFHAASSFITAMHYAYHVVFILS